jgi:hypothetical protein
VWHALLLTRPYSWLDACANVLLGVAIGGAASNWSCIIAAVIGLGFWFSLNWVSERVQRNPSRLVTTWPVAITPALIATVTAISTLSFHVLWWLVALWALIFIYPIKARNQFVGPIGPLLRGLQTGCLLAIGAAFGHGSSVGLWITITGFALVQISRSLLADIRDIATDQFELPRLVGSPSAKYLAALLLLAGIFALYFARAPWIAVTILIWQLVCMTAAPPHWSYALHMLFVAASTISKGAFFFYITGQGLEWGFLVFFAQVVLLTSYVMIPRPANLQVLGWMQRGATRFSPGSAPRFNVRR